VTKVLIDSIAEPEKSKFNGRATGSPVSRKRELILRPLAFVASLRVTVVLFAFALVLIFLGTLAQIDQGIWTVLNTYFRCKTYVWVPFQLFVQFGQVFLGIPASVKVRGSFPYPGGWLIGGLLLVNLLAAHATRFRVSWRRSGILLIHSGLVIMMLGELVTGLFAIEGRMSIADGETVNFVDVSNRFELALTDSSDAKTDRISVIPASMLTSGQTIRHPDLPVDVKVLEYMKNSDLVPVRPGENAGERTRADAGGMAWKLLDRAEESGAGSEREDAPAVRVSFSKKGSATPLGTYLLSAWYYPNFTSRQYQFPPQIINVDGKNYTVELRPKRIYKPYQIHLKEFRHEVYLGTETPKDFTSFVHLSDPGRGEEQDVKIYMNNPLRYAGETFYQTSFFPGDTGSVLQVVRNPGWEMPYVSCGLVAGGMIVHFGLHLLGFLRRRFAQ
jgi:ResB-like family